MPGAHRIVAGVSGSPGSVHALRQAAELARRHDAVLIPLLANGAVQKRHRDTEALK